MKFLEGKTQREKLLVIGLIVALFFGSYLVLRVSNLQKEVVKNEKTFESETKRLANLEKQTKDVRPSSKIEKQVKNIEAALKSERDNLQAFDFKFVDLSNEEELLLQIAKITEKAESNQLRILSRTNELRPLTSVIGNVKVLSSSTVNAANTASPTNIVGDQLQRRMYRLKLRGTFKSTYDFIKDLQTLDYGVLIAKLDIAADDKSTYNGIRLVVTDITIAI